MSASRAREGGARRGFTLLETLVAFAIMAAALAALFGAFGDGLRGVRAAEARLALTRAGESVLAGLGATVPLAPGTHGGESGAIRWTMTIAPAGTAPAPPGMVPLLDIRLVLRDDTGRRAVFRTQRIGAAP